MRKYIPVLLSCIILFSCDSSSQPVVTKANDKAIIAHGRAVLNANNDVVLISPGSFIEFGFTGNQCSVFLKNATYPGDYNYVAVELDGKYMGRWKVDGTTAKPYVLDSIGNKPHTLRIYKATEAGNGQVILTQVVTTGLNAIKQETTKKIEFIGNSITAGMANDTKDIPCGTGKWYDQHNAYWAYGPRVARALKADFMLSAVSGAGIYRHWNTDSPTIPQVYESAFLSPDSSTRRWDFSKYIPDVVSIALGTNDLSDGDGKTPRLPFDSAVFIKTYISFIGTIYKHYPSTQIALLTSPMLTGVKRDLHLLCLQSVKARIALLFPDKRPIEIFQFKPMVPKGCDYHPDLADHETLANEVMPFFEKLFKN